MYPFTLFHCEQKNKLILLSTCNYLKWGLDQILAKETRDCARVTVKATSSTVILIMAVFLSIGIFQISSMQLISVGAQVESLE